MYFLLYSRDTLYAMIAWSQTTAGDLSMARRRFSREEIDTFRQRASGAPPATKKEGITLREAVIELADEMIDMRDNRGYSIPALVEWWHEQEVKISVATLRKYLLDAKRSSRKRRKAPPRTRADHTTPSATGDPPASPLDDPPSPPSDAPPAARTTGSTVDLPGYQIRKDL